MTFENFKCKTPKVFIQDKKEIRRKKNHYYN